jgi:hypothetical protein
VVAAHATHVGDLRVPLGAAGALVPTGQVLLGRTGEEPGRWTGASRIERTGHPLLGATTGLGPGVPARPLSDPLVAARVTPSATEPASSGVPGGRTRGARRRPLLACLERAKDSGRGPFGRTVVLLSAPLLAFLAGGLVEDLRVVVHAAGRVGIAQGGLGGQLLDVLLGALAEVVVGLGHAVLPGLVGDRVPSALPCCHQRNPLPHRIRVAGRTFGR